jgi:hypothetical protein
MLIASILAFKSIKDASPATVLNDLSGLNLDEIFSRLPT